MDQRSIAKESQSPNDHHHLEPIDEARSLVMAAKTNLSQLNDDVERGKPDPILSLL